MSNNINVKLKVVDGLNVLDIDDGGGANHVSHNPKPQTISWNLTGNLAQASFQPMTATPPGFKWLDEPPSGVFCTPAPSNGGRQLEIQDTNSGTTTAGTWKYQIAVNLNGSIYVSQSTLPTGTVKDPVIINKEP